LEWVDVGDGTFRATNLSDKDQRFLAQYRLAEKAEAANPPVPAKPQSETLAPRPSRDAIAKAAAKVREVYKANLEKAYEPKEKAALAGEFLKTADAVDHDDASRLALLLLATSLAVDAGDAPLAMRAVAASVGRFEPDGPADPKEQIERGNALWKEGDAAGADKRLALRVQAAAWYLRAKASASGFDKAMIEKRLGELGAPALSPAAHAARVTAQPDAKKTFLVTYRQNGVKGKPVHTDEIHAASAQDAKDEFHKLHPRMKHVQILSVEEKK
jgi:hypothetical protein